MFTSHKVIKMGNKRLNTFTLIIVDVLPILDKIILSTAVEQLYISIEILVC
jgi:hypothetical protein